MRPYTASDANAPGVDTDFEDAVLEVSAALGRLPNLRFGYVPAEGGVLRMLTSMFMHEGWFHLIGNMVFLFLSGAVLECFWRPWAYAGLFVLAGLGGAVAHHLSDPTSAVPLIGASGAVAGLMAAFLVGHAQVRIRIGYFFWFFVAVRAGTFEMRALYLVPIWALQQAYHAWSEPGGAVAYAGHVGEFLVGLAVSLVARKLGWVARDAGYALQAPSGSFAETRGLCASRPLTSRG